MIHYNMDPIQAINEACSPDATKALFMGECGVSWSAFKDVQRAILEQARLNMGWKCSGCGSTKHILWLRDHGHVSCCPERELIPPNVTHQPAQKAERGTSGAFYGRLNARVRAYSA